MTQAELAALGQGTTVQPIPTHNSGAFGTLGPIYGAPQNGFFNNLPAGSPNIPSINNFPQPQGQPTGLSYGNKPWLEDLTFGSNPQTTIGNPQGSTAPMAPQQPAPTGSVAGIGGGAYVPPGGTTTLYNTTTGASQQVNNQYLQGFLGSGWTTSAPGNGTSMGTTGSTPPPPGSVANLYNSVANPDQAQLDAMYGIVNDTSQITDPTQILNNTLAQYQAQIDATNAMFADQLNNARIQGQGRIESRQFAQGRAGQIGSGTGEAGINAVQDANNQITKSIQAEQAAAIQAILTQTRNEAAAILKANTEAKKAGAQATLEFLNVTKPAMKKKATVNAINSLISKGITELTKEELKSYTDGLGITEGEFTSTFEEIIAQQVEAMNKQAKADADIARVQAETEKTIAETGQVGKMTPYQSAQLAIDWYKAKNPTMSVSDKKLNAIGGIAALFSPSEKDANGASITTIPNSGGVPYVDNNGFITPEGFKTVLREAAGEVTRKEILDQFGSQLSPTQYALYGLTAKEIADISNS